jgi:hypothetical protein
METGKRYIYFPNAFSELWLSNRSLLYYYEEEMQVNPENERYME